MVSKELFILVSIFSLATLSCTKENTTLIINEADDTPRCNLVLGNLFPDGGCEDFNTVATNWNIQAGQMILDTSIKYQGNSSLFKSNIGTSDFYHKAFLVCPNVNYEISFWWKAKGNVVGIDEYIIGFKQNGNWYGGATMFSSSFPLTPVDYDWTYYSNIVQFGSDDPVQFYWHANVDSAWIDDLSLRKL